MPRVRIPDNSGPFHVSIARAGNYIVVNDRTGRNKVVIACIDRQHAEELCERLNAGDHNGEVHVPGMKGH